MKYQVHDLGQLSGGEIVEVSLAGTAANVKLMDSSNLSNYKYGKNHKYYGGYVKHSPYRVSVPNFGRWYITIDLGGYSGTIRSSVRVIK